MPTYGSLERRRVDVRRDRYNDLYIVSYAPALELRLGFDHVLDAGMTIVYMYSVNIRV